MTIAPPPIYCPTPPVEEADDNWGYCDKCGCQNTGCSVFPPQLHRDCSDHWCIPCGHYAWQLREADEMGQWGISDEEVV